MSLNIKLHWNIFTDIRWKTNGGTLKNKIRRKVHHRFTRDTFQFDTSRNLKWKVDKPRAHSHPKTLCHVQFEYTDPIRIPQQWRRWPRGLQRHYSFELYSNVVLQLCLFTCLFSISPHLPTDFPFRTISLFLFSY